MSEFKSKGGRNKLKAPMPQGYYYLSRIQKLEQLNRELEAELQALRGKKAQENEREAYEAIADSFRLLANLRGTDLQEIFLKGADPEGLIPKNELKAAKVADAATKAAYADAATKAAYDAAKAAYANAAVAGTKKGKNGH